MFSSDVGDSVMSLCCLGVGFSPAASVDSVAPLMLSVKFLDALDPAVFEYGASLAVSLSWQQRNGFWNSATNHDFSGSTFQSLAFLGYRASHTAQHLLGGLVLLATSHSRKSFEFLVTSLSESSLWRNWGSSIS